VLYAARAKLGVLPSKQWSISFWRAVHDRLQPLASAQQPCAAPGDNSSVGITTVSTEATTATSSSAGGSPGGWQVQQAAAGASLQEQQQVLVQALQALPSGVLKPAVVSELTWSAGKLWVQAPVDPATLQLLLAAAAAVAPACSFPLLTAIGIGIKHMLHATKQLERRRARRRGVRRLRTKLSARTPLQQQRQQQTQSSVLQQQRQAIRASKVSRATHVRQYSRKPCTSDSSSSRGARLARARSRRRARQQQAGADRVTLHGLRQLAALVWSAWFARSAQLLLQAQAAVASAATAAAQAQQRVEPSAVPATSLLQQAGPAASLLQQPAHRPLQPYSPAAAKLGQHQQGAARGLQLGCKDVSMQLRLVASLRLRPAPSWWLAAVAVAEAGISSSTAEALSWLLLDLIKVQQLLKQPCGMQLPQGFVLAVLQRVRVLHENRVGWSPMQMLRMQSAMRSLREGGVVSAGEWQQWQWLLAVWRDNQGMGTAGQ
jgi:hypothetical protein